MKLHPRHVPVELAYREIAGAATDAIVKHGLSRAEYASILIHLATYQVESIKKSEWEKSEEK